MRRSKQFVLAGIIAMSLFMISGAFAQDPVKVDSTHYKVAFENDEVRILRITYGPGEKSIMHEHPNAVAVFLTDVQGQFTFPDGETQAMAPKPDNLSGLRRENICRKIPVPSLLSSFWWSSKPSRQRPR